MNKNNDTQNLNLHIGVENFGPIEKADIDLRPLTVFVGESNTGKTYLATLIYSLYKYFDGISRFPWSYHAHTIFHITYKSSVRTHQNVTKLNEELNNTLEKLNTRSRPFRYSDLPNRIRIRLESNINKSESFIQELKRCYDLESSANLIRLTGGIFNKLKVELNVYDENQLLWSYSILHHGPNPTAEGSVNKDIILKSNENMSSSEIYDFDDLVSLIRHPRLKTLKSYYLPASRSGIMQSRDLIVSSVMDRVVSIGMEHLPGISTFSGTTVDFIKHSTNQMQYVNHSHEMENIAASLENDVLYGKIKVKRHAKTDFPQFHYHPLKTGIGLRMSGSSSMVSELAPLVFFLRGIVVPGDTLIIEEPEAHLHPRAQTQIAITLARLVRAGVRVIITTHSDWLLEQIGNLVREGEVMRLNEELIDTPTTWLTEDEVGAWRFHINKPVEEIKFDIITGFEPQDYGEVAEDLYNRSVDLRTLLKKKMGDSRVE